MNMLQSIAVIAYVVLFFLIMCAPIWVMIITHSRLYKTYIYEKRIKMLLGEYNTHRLRKKRELLKQKILEVHVVNTMHEPIENAESFLNFSVQPIVFEQNVIAHELACMKFTSKDVKVAMEEYIMRGIMPIRTQFASPISGVDQHEDVKQCFLHKYPSSVFFTPDQFLSPLFMDTLLTKKIVLLELCYHKQDFSNHIDVLLIPYQRKTSNQSASDGIPVYPEELVK